MPQRFISIWFCNLHTDWFARGNPALQNIPFVLAQSDHGRMVVSASNHLASKEGIDPGISLADARAIIPSLEVLDDQAGLSQKLLTRIAEWCIRFTPLVGIDMPDGLILDITGCAHLWGGEREYLKDIGKRFKKFGYTIRAAVADTIGTAWAVARYGTVSPIVDPGQHISTLQLLPPQALRISSEITERLEKLGLRQIGSFITMARPSLRRRFGEELLHRLDQATGAEEEWITPVQPIEPYQERLPCMDPIVTATGIEIALQRLLEIMCTRLQKEQKGVRTAILKCYRLDGKIEKLEIGTHRATCNTKHLFKLFEINIDTIEPDLGIELFTLDAPKTDDLNSRQETMWTATGGLEDHQLSELLDRISGKLGADTIHRYVPDQHYWPERSYKLAVGLQEQPSTPWKHTRPRPLHLLAHPQVIEVTAPIPDYPPMLFRYRGVLHKIARADGPERIEQEWWLQDGQHRDYYYVEDEAGKRYWIFRSGHYDAAKTYKWFIHGFFV